MLTTADVMLNEFYVPSVYSCLFEGWVAGILQPRFPAALSLAWFITIIAMPVLPPLVGYMLTGEAAWVLAALRALVLPVSVVSLPRWTGS